jgi:hypothetical protein
LLHWLQSQSLPPRLFCGVPCGRTHRLGSGTPQHGPRS